MEAPAVRRSKARDGGTKRYRPETMTEKKGVEARPALEDLDPEMRRGAMGEPAAEGLTDEERYDILAGIFNKMPRKLGGYRLREMSAGSFDLLRRHGNHFLENVGVGLDDGREVLGPEETWGITEFVWLHVAPLPEVVRVAEDPAAWRAAVRGFSLEGMSFAVLAEFAESFARTAAEVTAALVDVLEEEGDDEPGKHRRSHTGSPATSMRSGGTSPESGGATSCGSSPSRKGSNTSTPLTAGTDGGAGGAPAMTSERAGETMSGSGRSGRSASGHGEPVERDWWVVGAEQRPRRLLLRCKLTGVEAAVYEPSEREWGEAFTADVQPYEWREAERAVVSAEEGGEPADFLAEVRK